MSERTSSREDLEKQAERIRSHLQSTAEELERKSGYRSKSDAATPAGERVASAAEREADGEDHSPEMEERRQLEQKADDVRERLADNVEQLERKARERLLPIVVAGSALLLLFTVGFAWMFYRTMKR